MILILFLGLMLHSALNSNKLTGSIPPSLGKLSSVTWLDLADNLLTGPLPNSKDNGTGLDQLLEAEHLSVSQKKISVLLLILCKLSLINMFLLFFLAISIKTNWKV